MPSQTTIRCYSADGSALLFETVQFLDVGSSAGLRYVLACGQIGALTVTLPPDYNRLLHKDARVFVSRSVNGGPAKIEGGSCFLIRKWEYTADYTTVTAVHANDIMRRRFYLFDNVYDSTNGFTTLPADDGIKKIWDRNFAGLDIGTRAFDSATSTYDSLGTNISAYVSRAANLSLAPTLTMKDFAYLNLLDIIHAIEDASYAAGTYLTSEIVAPTETTLQFQTFINQRGVDRRFSTGNGMIFSAVRGNLENVLLSIDATEEITQGNSLGGAPRGARLPATYHDTARVTATPFGRIETIVDANDATDYAVLTNAAKAGVQAGWPITIVTGDLLETDQSIRGIHYDFGDYVTIEAFGQSYDMRLNVLDVTVTGSEETTKAGFRYEQQAIEL